MFANYFRKLSHSKPLADVLQVGFSSLNKLPIERDDLVGHFLEEQIKDLRDTADASKKNLIDADIAHEVSERAAADSTDSIDSVGLSNSVPGGKVVRYDGEPFAPSTYGTDHLGNVLLGKSLVMPDLSIRPAGCLHLNGKKEDERRALSSFVHDQIMGKEAKARSPLTSTTTENYSHQGVDDMLSGWGERMEIDVSTSKTIPCTLAVRLLLRYDPGLGVKAKHWTAAANELGINTPEQAESFAQRLAENGVDPFKNEYTSYERAIWYATATDEHFVVGDTPPGSVCFYDK